MEKITNTQKEELTIFVVKEVRDILFELLNTIEEKSIEAEIPVKYSKNGKIETWILWFQKKEDHDAAVEKYKK